MAMKIHTKKKAVRAAWKELAKAGKIPNGSGTWINRSSASDNSMRRDFYPQQTGA